MPDFPGEMKKNRVRTRKMVQLSLTNERRAVRQHPRHDRSVRSTPMPQSITIPLTQGRVALIDADDFHLVAGTKWRAYRTRWGRWYAAGHITIDGRLTTQMLSRVITGVAQDERVEFANGDSLDNRRVNLRIVPRVSNPVERFWDQVEKRDRGCWDWRGSIDRYGYGRFVYRAADKPSRHVLAHRWAFEHARGPIPDGLTIDHLCLNHRCVNPDHMELVTRAENARRATNDRQPIGGM